MTPEEKSQREERHRQAQELLAKAKEGLNDLAVKVPALKRDVQKLKNALEAELAAKTV